ncbi:MAG: deoxyguanosinetriphosphate triphosphohydrolase [Alphaproteobacteria bacterium]|nr:deoxyguanosinetriphosphate triphosphohydrolase [Alphaproteobacteria bacterium]
MTDAATGQPSYNYCALPLVSYACRPDQSRGRLYDEPPSKYRTEFHRDRDRIIHASAFRRLKYKTQVFVYHEGDHYRTRLSHTLEVAQVTRALARALMINEDLAESVALAHDLGHTPFAHMGEVYLQECMAPYGGFEHNDQSLRILTFLERKYPRWPGLNLTWETLEGVVKHNGPVSGPLPVTLEKVSQDMDLELSTHATIEAQAAAIADDIAYNNHDVEDGLRAGLFTLGDLEDIPLLADVLDVVRADFPDIEEHYLVQEMVREMIGAMVADVLEESRARIAAANPQSPEDVRTCGRQLIGFSAEMEARVDELRDFLFERMYRHYTINRIWLKVERLVHDLFKAFFEHPGCLPDRWQQDVKEAGGLTDDAARARVICDYIAGMTDRYAMREHERLFNLHWDLR